METPVQPAPKKMNTGLIIGVVVVVLLCCCCVIVGGGGYYYYSTQVKNTYSSINEALQTPVVPDIPAVPTSESGVPEMPTLPSDVIPQGGLGDDILRADTWVYVLSGAAAQSCAVTDPGRTVIEVLAQPDSAGVWQEKWTVSCDDGSKKAFEVTFTPSSQGGTDISVKSSK